MDSGDGQMTIGEFGRRARLSAKALRLYDQLGLLAPASVDPYSRYRRYSPAQLARARRIVLLRGIGLPLAHIADLLDLDDPALIEAVRAWWRRAEHRHDSRRSLVRYLGTALIEGTTTMYQIRTRQVPEQKVLSMQRRVAVDGLPGFFDEGMPALFKHLEATPGAEPAGPPMAIFHGPVNEDADGPVEICLPFTGTVEPTAELSVRVEAAHREAYTTLTKDHVAYPKILQAYDAVQQWLVEQGHRMTASPREVYLVDWSTVGPDEPACDIAYPFGD